MYKVEGAKAPFNLHPARRPLHFCNLIFILGPNNAHDIIKSSFSSTEHRNDKTEKEGIVAGINQTKNDCQALEINDDEKRRVAGGHKTVGVEAISRKGLEEKQIKELQEKKAVSQQLVPKLPFSVLYHQTMSIMYSAAELSPAALAQQLKQ